MFAQVRSIGVQLGSSAMRAPPGLIRHYSCRPSARVLTDHRGRCHAGAKASADGIATAAASPRSAGAAGTARPPHTGATVQCHLATLNAGAAWRIHITVTVKASTGTLRDQANITSVTPGPRAGTTPPPPPPRRSPGRPATGIRSGTRPRTRPPDDLAARGPEQAPVRPEAECAARPRGSAGSGSAAALRARSSSERPAHRRHVSRVPPRTSL